MRRKDKQRMKRRGGSHWRSLKTLAMEQPAGSIARVVIHGFWQGQRGRNPSEALHCAETFQSSVRNP